MVEGLTEHVPIAAMYAAASASRLWEDRPSPPLAQAAQDAPDAGPTAEDVWRILSSRAPPKTHAKLRPIQLVSWDAMDAPPASTEVHILKHRNIWWTVEGDDHGKVRRATANTPDHGVLPPPRGGDCLQLAARVPTPQKQPGKRCTTPSTWRRGRQRAPSPRNPPQRGHATPTATRPTCAATGQAPGTGSSPGPRTRPTPYGRPIKCLAS